MFLTQVLQQRLEISISSFCSEGKSEKWVDKLVNVATKGEPQTCDRLFPSIPLFPSDY